MTFAESLVRAACSSCSGWVFVGPHEGGATPANLLSGAAVKLSALVGLLPKPGPGTSKSIFSFCSPHKKSGTQNKPVKMVFVAYGPRLSWNLLPARKVVEQWGKPLVYYKPNAALGFLGKESLVVKSSPRKELFSGIGVRRTPSQGASLALAAKTADAVRIEATGQKGPCADVRRSSS